MKGKSKLNQNNYKNRKAIIFFHALIMGSQRTTKRISLTGLDYVPENFSYNCSCKRNIF